MTRSHFLSLAGAMLLGALPGAWAQDMDFVDHLAIDNPDLDYILPVNYSPVGVPYDSVADIPGGYGTFDLFTTKQFLTSRYTDTGFYRGPGYDSGWSIQSIPFGTDMTLGTPSIVSRHWEPGYTGSGPSVIPPDTAMTGTRNSYYLYSTGALVRASTATLSLDPSGPLFLPATNIMALNEQTALFITQGGIYEGTNMLSAANGRLAPLVTASGTGAGQLSNPTAVNLGPDGLVYVLDTGNNAIKRYDFTTGEFRGEFALPAGLTIAPTSLAISSSGRIYLDDGAGGGAVLTVNGDLIQTFAPPTGTDWTQGTVSTSGVNSYLYYDMMGNVFTYLKGSGIFMYHDANYLTPSLLKLDLTGAMTTASEISSAYTQAGTTIPAQSITPAFDSITFAPDSALTVGGTALIQTGSLTVASGTATVGGGSLLTPDGTDMVKTGTGVLILENANTYTARTVVKQGKLVVNGSIAGDTEVQAGSTLGGHGILAGHVVVQDGGTLTPGESPGRMTIGGDLTLSGSSTVLMEFSGTGEGLYDQLTVQGIFQADGTLNLVILDGFTPEEGMSFTIFDGDTPGFDTGSFTIITNLGAGLNWDTSSLASTGVVTIIPEPSTSLMAALGLSLILIRQRRRPLNLAEKSSR